MTTGKTEITSGAFSRVANLGMISALVFASVAIGYMIAHKSGTKPPAPNPHAGLIAKLAELEAEVETGITHDEINRQLVGLRAELKLHPIMDPNDKLDEDIIETDCELLLLLCRDRDMQITRRGEDPVTVTVGPRAEQYADWRESNRKATEKLLETSAELRARLTTNSRAQ